MRRGLVRRGQPSAAVGGSLRAALDRHGAPGWWRGRSAVSIGRFNDGKLLEPRCTHQKRSSAGPNRSVPMGAAPHLLGPAALPWEHGNRHRPLSAAGCGPAALSRWNVDPHPHTGSSSAHSVRRQTRSLRLLGARPHPENRLSEALRLRRRPCPSPRRRGRVPCGPPRPPCRRGLRRLHPSKEGRTSCREECPRGSSEVRGRRSFARSP
jgi:hypothetical protein